MERSEYLLNLCGFCARMVPYVLLLYLPHLLRAEERFRVRPALVKAVLAAFLAASAALYPFYPGHMLRNPCEAAVKVLCLLFFAAVIRGGAMEKIVMFFTAEAFSAAQLFILMITDSARTLMETQDPVWTDPVFFHTPANVGVLFLADAALFPLAVLIALRIVWPCIQYASPGSLWLDMGVIFVLDVVLLPVGFFLEAACVSVGGGMWAVLACAAVIVAAHGLLVYLVFLTTLTRAREQENRIQMELMRDNSRYIQRELERSRVVYHDLRQLLRQLYAVSGDKSEELRPYIERITDLAGHTDLFFCENKCLNALFQYYTGLAQSRDIPISISAEVGELSVNDADLSVLFSNAMENAVTGAEEFRQQTGQEPKITVVAGVVKNRLACQMDNSCAAVRYARNVPGRDHDSLLTADAFLSVHEHGGHGLRRMQFLASKYRGQAYFRFDERQRLWTTRIQLTIQEG